MPGQQKSDLKNSSIKQEKRIKYRRLRAALVLFTGGIFMNNNRRKAVVERKTAETSIYLELNIDGNGEYALETGVPFLEHMLALWARNGRFDITIKAAGDIEVEPHHLVEDVGLCLGKALLAAAGEKKGIARYGSEILPMDETLVMLAVDFSGRPYLVYDLPINPGRVGDFDVELSEEFWRALVNEARINLHVKLLHGSNRHHILEALFKSAGRAMGAALSRAAGSEEIPSTKGVL